MCSRFRLLCKLVARGFDPGMIVTWLSLHRALQGCRSVCDIGCGAHSPLALFEIEELSGVDGYRPSVEKARAAGTHKEVIEGDVRALDTLLRPGQFECCVALDVIEHIPKADGFKMIRDMERASSRRTIFLTPSGFLPQGNFESGDLQAHQSGWEAEEMRAQGYEVTGLLGPKQLRGECHVLRRRPKIFWGLVSLLGHFFQTRHRPERAAAILCVKERRG